MNLPYGVSYHPRQKDLIQKDGLAVIQIKTGNSYPGNEKYKINNRTFEQAVAPFLHGDWEDFDRLFRLDPRRVVYSGAEHPDDLKLLNITVPKLPNITVVPNFTTESRGLGRPLIVFGCTMGHYHPETPQGYRIQEVYEFQSYGMLVLDREEGEVEMWVAQDGDKVAVPNGCHMTLYNLGDEDHPLVTLDFADPARNPSNKDLISKCGPILLGYYDDFEVVFTLNRLYINSLDHEAGVRLVSPPEEERDRRVRIARGSRLNLGQFLYEQLTQNPDVIGRFAQLDIHIKRASREAVLEPLPPGQGSRLYFSLPLVEATKQGTEVYRYFFPAKQLAVPGLPQGKGIAAMESEKTKEKERLIQLCPLINRPLVIVVEGAGDWVEQCYRPLFKKIVNKGRRLSVFYADDTRWKGRPKWANPSDLESWEIYLDKADPSDSAQYQNLAPSVDVVFIVTPDFTHSAIACWWASRRVPLVLVEKPFDSQLDNVNALLLELGRRRTDTAILGLDHYQFYALPLHELLPEIEQHLGRALAKVVFYMTEDRPIELGRERSLQYGLTLDMLPHMLALLTYFGEVGTIDEIRVIEAGQYDPLVSADKHDLTKQRDLSGVFRNETYSRVKFTFQDYSGTGYHIPCVGVVGKGFFQGPKYLEITGQNGNAIRVDLNRTPKPNQNPDYPWDSLFFLQGSQVALPPGAQAWNVPDPYNPKRALRILYDPNNPQRFCRSLERARYERLLEDLLNGTRTAVASTLLITEAWEVVRALDRIWWAIQASREQWMKYELNKLNPIQLGDDP